MPALCIEETAMTAPMPPTSSGTSPVTAFRSQADALVAQMSVEEQALLLSGDGWWQTHGIERLGLAPMVVSDGPHGLRKVVGAGLEDSVPAIVEGWLGGQAGRARSWSR